MHSHDVRERLASKHGGSKSRRKHAGSPKQKRRDQRIRQRSAQAAKLDTLNQGVMIRDEA